MLKRLLKYEYKNLSRMLWPILLGMLGLSVLGFGIVEIIILTLDDLFITLFMLGTFCGFLVIAILLAPVVAIFIIVMRFYKNMFTDEGYLSFVLPVSIHTQLTAKLISGSLWTLIYTVASMLAFGIFFGIPILIHGGDFLAELWSVLLALLGARPFTAVLYLFEILLAVVVGAISQTLLYYASVTVGSTLMPKHKILGSILFYFVINAITNILSGTVGTVLSYTMSMSMLSGSLLLLHLSMFGSILLSVALGVAAYIVTAQMLKNKLNLE